MDDGIDQSGLIYLPPSGTLRTSTTAPLPVADAKASTVYFSRRELGSILNIYGRMVAAGFSRDYAIDQLADMAVFSIFRRASEMPIYRIIKEPTKRDRQGMWRIVGMDGRIYKRGHDLGRLLVFFENKLSRTVKRIR